MDQEEIQEQIRQRVREQITEHLSGPDDLETLVERRLLRGITTGLLAGVGISLLGAPLISIAAVLGGGMGLLSAAGFISRFRHNRAIVSEIARLDSLIEERDKLIERAVSEGHTPDNLGRYTGRVNNLSKAQQRQASKIRGVMRQNQELVDQMSLREQGQLEGLLRAAEDGRLTALSMA